jgi:hypothetical protein
MRGFYQDTNAKYIRLRDGSLVKKVRKSLYFKCEQIRNYIYRTNYERGISIEILSLKAQCLFGVDDNMVYKALYEWKNWCYGAGVRHRPIEKFIEDDINRLQSENELKIEIKNKQHF